MCESMQKFQFNKFIKNIFVKASIFQTVIQKSNLASNQRRALTFITQSFFISCFKLPILLLFLPLFTVIGISPNGNLLIDCLIEFLLLIARLQSPFSLSFSFSSSSFSTMSQRSMFWFIEEIAKQILLKKQKQEQNLRTLIAFEVKIYFHIRMSPKIKFFIQMSSGAISLAYNNTSPKNQMAKLFQDRMSNRNGDFYQPYSAKTSPRSPRTKQLQLLALCLRRFANDKVRKAYAKIRAFQPKRPDLSLLEEKRKKILKTTFAQIFSFSLNKIVSKKNTMKKNPKFIFLALSKMLKKDKKLAFSKILSQQQRKNNIRKFASLFRNTLVKTEKSQKKQCFLKMKSPIQNNLSKRIMLKNAVLVFAKMQLKAKQRAWKDLTNYLNTLSLQTVKQAKQSLNVKIQQKNSNRYRDINEERDKLKNAKFQIDFASSARNKAKVDLKKELNMIKAEANQEIKEQEKIRELFIKQIEKKKKDMKTMKENRQRNMGNQKKAQNMVQKALKTYKVIVNSKQVRNSQISIPKAVVADLKKVTIDSDHFCIPFNEKLRSQLRIYEKGLCKENEGSQLIRRQNTLNKEIIGATVQKYFEDYTYKNDLESI